VLTLDANPPVGEPKMAASGEMVAGFHDPPINLIQTDSSSKLELSSIQQHDA
jgi:hypothetical protein